MKNYLLIIVGFASLLFLSSCASGGTDESGEYCGDGICNGEEDNLTCSADCKDCGNSEIDPGEDCDTGNLNSQTCESINAGTGDLFCKANCKFELANCTGKDCVNQCFYEGYNRCNGNLIEVCNLIEGCLTWFETGDCEAGGNICDDSGGTAACTTICSDACTDGTKRCSGNIQQTCGNGANGCLQWVDDMDCAAFGQNCYYDASALATSCISACTDECAPQNSHQCLGTNSQICDMSEYGCLTWETTEDCNDSGKTCTGLGICECPTVCVTNDTRCNVNYIQTCEMGTNGCMDYVDGVNCEDTTEVCNENTGSAVCSEDCSDTCSDGEYQCSGSWSQQCQMLTTGCWGYVNSVNCDTGGQECAAGSGQCECNHECNMGETECLDLLSFVECETNSSGCRVYPSSAPLQNICFPDICLFGACQ
jgi:large repetitive protein